MASAIPGPEASVRSAAEPPVPCLVRDPEDGACYPSADAADLAWLSRGASPAILANVEDDPDEGEDVEDGDTLLPRGRRLPLAGAARAPEARSLLARIGQSLKGIFVVRKSDSKPASIPEEEVVGLLSAEFPIPLESFPSEKLRDSFFASRGKHRRHHAIDLPAPRGTPVVAVVDGTIGRLGRDRKGGLVCYLRDLTGRYTFYYAHLKRHAKGLKIGDCVQKGQQIGEVGSTGRVIGGPHLHFAIFREADDESTWKGFAVNPYLLFAGLN